MNIEFLSDALIYLWLLIFLLDQLVFKYFILKELKSKYYKIWNELGSPTVLSSKESIWSLIGLSSDFDLTGRLTKEKNSSKTIKLLKRYRYFSYFDMALLVIVMMFVILK
jgi:hypothetical protein